MTTAQQTAANEERWDCALIQDTLPLYLEDEVSPDSRSLIIEHLSNCPHCAGYLAGAQSARGHLRHKQPRAPSPPIASPQTPASAPAVQNRLSVQGLLGVVLLTVGTLWLAAALIGFGRSTPVQGSAMPTPTPFFSPIEETVMLPSSVSVTVIPTQMAAPANLPMATATPVATPTPIVSP